MLLGIDENQNVIYEGRLHWGARAVFPTPNLFTIQIAETPEEASHLVQKKSNPRGLLFREDSFDPGSMVRRGRIYKANPSYPTECRVCPISPAELAQTEEHQGVIRKQLRCFHPYLLNSQFPTKRFYAAIGDVNSYSMWRIVSSDRMRLNEELVTMRPVYFLGALPDLSEETIPERWRLKVTETTEKVVASMYKADAGSIIELCRHAASASLFAFFVDEIQELNKSDLGALANKAHERGKRIVASSARTIADLHSRVKPNMELEYGFSPVCDRDAELAIQCLSFILRDLGYAKSH